MSLGLIRALLITDPLIIVATIVMGSVNLAMSFFDPSGNVQVGIARQWSRLLLKIAGVRVDWSGLEKIDTRGSYVFAPNHSSYMDTPVVLALIPVQFRFLAKEGLFRIPFLGHHLKRAGHIPVPRENPRQALKTMSEAGRTLKERGTSLLIFPEGGRTRTGELDKFKEGAAYIAIKAGVPIVPIALEGTREVLPMGSANVRPGVVTMKVGDPIPTEGLTLHDRARLTEELYDRVAEMLGRPVEAKP